MNITTQITKMTQQRHILAQMGIDCWVTRDCQTQQIPTIDAFNNSLSSLKLEINTADSDCNSNSSKEIHLDTNNVCNETANNVSGRNTLQLSSLQGVREESDLKITSSIPTGSTPTVTIPTIVKDTDKDISTETEVIKESNHSFTDDERTLESEQSASVVPFTLQGVKYGSWVLLVDEANISESVGELWQKICQALSLNIEQLKFPIYENMNSVEFANATLAGFIFKLTKREEVKIGILTALAEGLDDNRILRLPSLEEMMAEPMLKQEFWRSLNG